MSPVVAFWTFMFIQINISAKIIIYVLSFKDCKDIVILHIGYLSYPNYEITVAIFGLEGMKYKVKDIDFTVSFMNDSLWGWHCIVILHAIMLQAIFMS